MRWLVLSTMVFFAATCGQKGPLTRPTPDPEPSPGPELLIHSTGNLAGNLYG